MTSPAPDPARPLTAVESIQWSAIAHFGGISLVLAVLLGFFGIGGLVQAIVALLALTPALVILIVFRRRDAKVVAASKEALNFLVTVLAVLLVWIIVSTVVVYLIASAMNGAYREGLVDPLVPPTDPAPAIASVRLWFGIPTVVIAGIGVLFSVVAGLFTLRGRSYRYPLALHLIH